MLSVDDLYRLELKVRTHAERLRIGASAFMESEANEVRAHAAIMRGEADEFDQVGNLLVGLQGNWNVVGPQVRDGYVALMAEFRKRKAVEDDAA